MKTKLILLFVLLINIIFLSMILFIVNSKERISFKLEGSNPVVLSIDESYEEPGYILESCRRNNCTKIDDSVTLTSNLDSKTIGVYTINYEYKHNDKKYNLTRTIRVKDNIPPELNLKGKESVFLCPNKEYTEEGYKAKDNYDGDLTNQVEVERKEDKIVYRIVDSSGNEVTKERKLLKNNPTKPTIKLKGSSKITVIRGKAYNEPGYTASEACGVDLTSKVEVSGKVDTNTNNTYTISYKVKDNYGNETTEKRTVVVTEQIKYTSFNTTDKNEYKSELTKYIKQKNYNIYVGYYNLKTGDSYYYRPSTVLFGASLVKTVDALYIYEKTNPDSATITKVKKAISRSDNAAHLALVKQIGRDKLKTYGQSLGAKHFLTSTVNLYYGETSVYDQIAIWKHLYQVINNNPKGNELKSFFINTYANHLRFDGLPTHMHKYGRADSYYHDVGLVFANEPYIIVVLTRHGESNYKAVINDISKKLYEYNRLDN